MKDQSSVEDRLRDLAEYLKQGRSLAPTVMQEVLNRSASPRVAAPTVARAWSISGPVARFAAMLVAAAIFLAAAVVYISHLTLTTTVAFADVQQAIRRVQTAIMVEDYPEKPWMHCRHLYRRDCEVGRTEYPGGIIYLCDTKKGMGLFLNPQKKTARTTEASAALEIEFLPWVAQGKAANLQEALDRLTDSEAASVERLGERQFDGQRLVGFALPRNKLAKQYHMLCQLWVDPRTRLPVRYELVPEDPNNIAARFRHWTLTFTLNEPLDASLFHWAIPEDYTRMEQGTEASSLYPLPPKDTKLASPVIQPNIGIGAARFGMSLNQVLEALGRPDDLEEYRELNAEQWRQIEEARKRAAKEADEKALEDIQRERYINQAEREFSSNMNLAERSADGMRLRYISRGFEVIVTNNKGLWQILCWNEPDMMRPFTGQTTRGIGMGATARQIEDAYGPPESRVEQRTIAGSRQALLDYKDLHMVLGLRDDRLWELVLDAP